jgi:hypothetical protein
VKGAARTAASGAGVTDGESLHTVLRVDGRLVMYRDRISGRGRLTGAGRRHSIPLSQVSAGGVRTSSCALRRWLPRRTTIFMEETSP